LGKGVAIRDVSRQAPELTPPLRTVNLWLTVNRRQDSVVNGRNWPEY
jgi:hypothetical protein